MHHGISYKANVELAEDYHLEVTTYEQAGQQLSNKIKKMRTDWLSSKISAAQKESLLLDENR